jgi:hypothetical protein
MQVEAEPITQRTDLVDLASFDGHFAADSCCEHLEKQGIEAHLYDERDVQTFLFLTRPKASLKVQVREEDYGKAVAQLIELEKQSPEVAALIYSCPDCGSFAVEYPQFSRKFITPLFLEWLSNLGLFEKQCYCRKCHCLWPRKPHKGINRRHLRPDKTIFVPPPA